MSSRASSYFALLALVLVVAALLLGNPFGTPDDADPTVSPAAPTASTPVAPDPAPEATLQSDLASPPRSAPSIDLLARLVHIDGRPAAGAILWTFEGGLDLLAPLLAHLPESERTPGSPAFLELGTRRAAGADGVVRWRHAGGNLFLVARDESAIGSGSWQDGDPTEFEIVLATPHDLTVRVVDPSGRPLAGVPVGFRWSEPSFEFASEDARNPLSGPDGLATIRDVMVPRNRDAPPPVRGWAYAEILGPEIPAVAVSIDPWPAEPVTLVVPPFGSLEVLAAVPAPVTGFCRLSLASDGTRSRLPRAAVVHRQLQEDGSATYPCVALDQTLQADFFLDEPAGRLRARGAGPTVAGATARLVASAAGAPILSGRLVETDGRPASAGPWHGELVSSSLRAGTTLTVGENGRFRLAVEPGHPGGPIQALEISPETQSGRGEPEPYRLARVELPAELLPGEHELGDFRLERPPVVVEGIVVDEEGRPIEPQSVRPEALAADRMGEQEIWHDILFQRTHAEISADGHFAVLGSLDPVPYELNPENRFRLHVTAPGYYQPTPAPFTLGQQDLRVVLLRGGAVAFAFQFPAGLRELRFVEVAVSSTETGRSVRAGSRGDGIESVVRALPPGPYLFEARLGGCDPPLLSLPVEVQAGVTTRDPRLLPFDLGNVLGVGRITVVDAQGEPWPRMVTMTYLRSNGGSGGSQQREQDGSYLVPFDRAAPADLSVGEQGRGRQVLLPSFDGDRTVVMAPPIEVVIELDAPLAPRPAGDRVSLRIERFALESEQRIPFSDVELQGDLLAGGRLRARFPSPGRYRWSWWIVPAASAGGASRRSILPGGEWRIDDASEGTVLRITPPPELREPR